MKKTKWIGIAVILLPILMYQGIRIANNHIADALEERLLSCPLPPETERIDSISVAGKVEGNGNGMQYFGAILVQSALDEDALTAYYNEYFLNGYFEDADCVEILRQESPVVFEYHDYRFDRFEESGDCYRIGLWIQSVAGCETSLWESILNFDLRGH